MHKVVNLPSGRVFLIGGAQDIECKYTYSNILELMYKENEGKWVSENRASMLIPRAAFGCAVYPNFS